MGDLEHESGHGGPVYRTTAVRLPSDCLVELVFVSVLIGISFVPLGWTASGCDLRRIGVAPFEQADKRPSALLRSLYTQTMASPAVARFASIDLKKKILELLVTKSLVFTAFRIGYFQKHYLESYSRFSTC
jgi:hypothetical protein